MCKSISPLGLAKRRMFLRCVYQKVLRPLEKRGGHLLNEKSKNTRLRVFRIRIQNRFGSLWLITFHKLFANRFNAICHFLTRSLFNPYGVDGLSCAYGFIQFSAQYASVEQCPHSTPTRNILKADWNQIPPTDSTWSQNNCVLKICFRLDLKKFDISNKSKRTIYLFNTKLM